MIAEVEQSRIRSVLRLPVPAMLPGLLAALAAIIVRVLVGPQSYVLLVAEPVRISAWNAHAVLVYRLRPRITSR